LKFEEITKEWICSIPKTINENGCWIPLSAPAKDGYSLKMVDRVHYRLARLVVSVYHNLSYHHQIGSKIWEARHNTGCDKRCFFHEHLRPGSASDNEYDKVRDGTHQQASKKVCPKCGGPYKVEVSRGWWGRTRRYCPSCRIANYIANKEKRRLNGENR
jgi:hypothetical protein